MKTSREVVQTAVRQGISVVCAVLLVVFPYGATVFAQGTAPVPPGPPPAAQAPAPAPAQLLTPDQLDNLVAPIALYPDPLLSQVLVASTYPLEIVEASQWLQQNGNLQGQQLIDAARQQNWDPSVQALVVFPDLMGRLSSNVGWTTDLGNAFLAQQADVMNAVQRMRAQAQAAGRLNSDAEQRVVTQSQDGRTVIEIEPANPQVVYVPEYNPEYIWGAPAWGYYPDLYYPAVGFGFGFGRGIFLDSYFTGWGGLGWGGWGGWGWGPNWFGCSILTNGLFFNHYGFRSYYGGGFGRGGVWAHNPYHRLGVPYSNARLAGRFGGSYLGRGGAVRGNFTGQRGGAFNRGRFQGGMQSFSRQGAFNGGPRAGAMNTSRFGGGPRAGAMNTSRFGGGPRAGAMNTSRFGGAQRGGAANTSRFGGAQRGGAANTSRFGGAQRGGAANTSRFGGAQSSRPQANGAASGGWRSFGSGNGYRSNPSSGGSYAGRGTQAYRQAPSYAGRGTQTYRQAPSYGGSSRSFSGGSRPSFSGGGSRSFSGGSRPSFSGGGGSRPSSGGGSRSFGGGGRSSGGGGHSGGGGRGGRR